MSKVADRDHAEGTAAGAGLAQRARLSSPLLRTLFVLGFAFPATQRLAAPTPVGAVPLESLIGLAVILLLLITGRGVIRGNGVVLLFTVIAILAVTSFVSSNQSTIQSRVPSVLSLVLLIQVLITFSVAPAQRERLGRTLMFGVLTGCVLGAMLGVVQFFAQRAGTGYVDWLSWIPSAWLRMGFNTFYSLEFVSGEAGFKPNGMIFLEPSMLSLYSALGLIVIMVAREEDRVVSARTRFFTAVAVVILLAGLGVSQSSSGLLALAAALVPVLLTASRHKTLIASMLALGAFAFFTGWFDGLISKATEGISGTTSTALRLYLPYINLAPVWLERPFFGWGPGTAAQLAETYSQIASGLQESTLMKALVEYGLVGSLAIAIVVATSFRRAAVGPRPLAFAIAFVWLFQATNLLSVSLAIYLVVGCAFWARLRDSPTAD